MAVDERVTQRQAPEGKVEGEIGGEIGGEIERPGPNDEVGGSEAGASSPHLDRDEQDQAAEHTALRALVIHEIVREEGEVELKRTTTALFWSGLAAGLSMGFSFLAQSLLYSGIPDAPWRHLIDALGYSVGFIIVILGRQQLFTESTLTAVLPVLMRPGLRTLGELLRLWAIVLVANLIGSWIVAWLLTGHGAFEPEVVAAMHTLSLAPMSADFWATVLKAVFAGWLIATMVWLLPSARSARLFIVLLVTYVVSAGHLAHVIAGSVESAYAVLTGGAALGDYGWKFLVPTLLGNTLGGVSFVALLNHAAIRGDIDELQSR
jgi:formate/nitrite transporter FocA (FNT family)